MAYNNDQNEFPLPGGETPRRKSAQHLPRYFRTEVNKKFLASTIDQMIQPGTAEKLNGYYGRRDAKGYQLGDFYVNDVSESRNNYQLEPAVLIKDDLDNINFYADYNDYINQLHNLGSAVVDHSVINQQEYYAWNPHIDWDKFVNFREYYWLPNGPQTVQVSGQSVDVESTYKVTAVDNGDNFGYVFSPDGLTQNPTLTLYRGITYRFEITAPGNPLSFRTRKQTAESWKPNTTYYQSERVLYEGSLYLAIKTHHGDANFNIDNWDLDRSFNLTDNISAQSVDRGVIELILDQSTPNIIYYMSDADINASGIINVKDISEATLIDVEKEILGKKSYKTAGGWEFSNGMKVEFTGTVVPEIYAEGAWFVEGVGNSIKLISEASLNIPSEFTRDIEVEFDAQGFDRLPYSEAIGYPISKDYITINRASIDGNLWSKYNRWFHKSVIEQSAAINNQEVDNDETARATRPIIEFEAGLKLFNFGTNVKDSIDLVDNFTKDAFSNIEGSQGYNIDGVDLTNGMRVMFIAEEDPLVNGKIFEVKFIVINNIRQITLVEVTDSVPLENETVLCKQGNTYKGKVLWFDGTQWKLAQSKTAINQSPLFDVYDQNGIPFSDLTVYESNTFTGTKIFSYKTGSGYVDKELGFPLSYRSIQNVGDIAFTFELLSDSFTYIPTGASPQQVYLSSGYLRNYSTQTNFEILNGWVKGKTSSTQPVIRQYVVDNSRTFYTIDVYDQSGLLDDLWVKVFVNNQIVFEGTDYTLDVDGQDNAIIRFVRSLNVGDNIIIKTRSSAVKNDSGKYEIANNLERNPLNNDIVEFTLGEVNDHVSTIVEELAEFSGKYPGSSNLRDLGNISNFGKRVVKHSAPINISAYHVVDKDANIPKALKYARREYGKFKRLFLQTAYNLGYSGPIKEHVDLILKEMVKDKTSTMPFYFSDMVPTGAANRTRIEIEEVDNIFFALTSPFNLTKPSAKSVQVYLNEVQLIHGKDYTFNDQGFVIIQAGQTIGDVVDIYEYETTNGCFVPPTPTKLGLYPKYVPEIFVDNTYLTPQTVIQGHDGSVTIAFGDFRDDLILELEKRIFNNIKVEYDPQLFNIHDFIPGHSRTTSLTETQINDGMISDFVQWLQLVDNDYTGNTAFTRTNQFTFNHTGMTDDKGQSVHGWWRAVYKYAYDTDRPHTHPWEMQGFTIKPTWWDAQYGEAPYTSNNFLMWEDIEAGIIREPGTTFRIEPKYKRDSLTTHLPVNENGELVSPVLSSFIVSYNTTDLNANFVYGDHGPVETAWRRSSEFPFALLTSLFLNQPSKTISVCFDRIRQTRDPVGHIVYNAPNRQLRLSDIEFPNTVADSERVFTSGLINYVFDYLASTVSTTYENYKTSLRSINNQIGFKIGGYTSKDKFKLILDSRTPQNQGNVFVPEENYKIFLNTSTPIKTVAYSGVIIEKQSYGFIVRGYNNEQPYFNYNAPIALANDSLINIGGISASFVYWESNRTYNSGAIVEYENSYYRATEGHISGTSFDNNKFAKIPKLPEVGGREAYFRKAFRNVTNRVPYGKVYKTIQEVVDFLLGYGYYLEQEGFVFDFYDGKDAVVSNWKTSAKEFMFWTTQNWGAGSVITLSPGANQLKFISQYAVVDDIYDTFYGYSLLKADGKKLVPQNASLTRENPTEFIIRPKATEDGIYAVRLALVQKEHAVVIDNKTVFGDIIYDQEPGYRQERIRVLGYRTADWDGSINIPGFIFDNAKVTEWEAWKDYAIGDLVQYKEFYYTARNKISGTEVFDADQWVRLTEKPEMELLPNWEYKTNQFADFYDLDTDNFDIEQQRFAQHLIGYQNRQYLANIINDDVSQYKFYQGMIQDKGTKNALTKLFDVLSSADKDSLEFYEEWAIKVGQYGAADGFEEVEFLLDESKFKLSPQSVELVNSVTGNETDLVYRIRPFEVYVRPENYTHAPFPAKTITTTYTKNAGYVNPDDVDFIVNDYDSILNINYDDCSLGSIIWVGNIDLDWEVLTHVKLTLDLEEIEKSGNNAILSFGTVTKDFRVGEIIGIEYVISTDGVLETKNGFYKIVSIKNNKVEFANLEQDSTTDIVAARFSKLTSVRAATMQEASIIIQANNEDVNRIWVDTTSTGQWQVYQRNRGWNQHQVVPYTELGSDHSYGTAIASDDKNTVLAVGAPDDSDGKVYIYTRAGNAGSYQLSQVIDADGTVADDLQRFGATVALSEDGRYLAVGSPNASNVKTLFQGDFDEPTNYQQYSIVRYQDSLWQAQKDIDGAEDNIIFGSFEAVAPIMVDLNQTDEDDAPTPVILTGDYPFTSVNTNHFLIKAPFNMYEGSGEGDTLVTRWNTKSTAHQDQVIGQVGIYNAIDLRFYRDVFPSIEPFNGTIPLFTSAFFTGEHTIAAKIDSILYIENSNTIPQVGQIVEAAGAFGTVAYTYTPSGQDARATIYIKNQNGSFGVVGSLTTSIGEYVGEYVTAAPTDVAVGAEEKWGGYWFIETETTYLVNTTNYEEGRGLVIYDIIPTVDQFGNPIDLNTYDDKFFYNILDYTNTSVSSSLDTQNSNLTTLSYRGRPFNIVDDYESDLFVLRAPSVLTDLLDSEGVVQGDPNNPLLNVFYNSMPNWLSGEFKDPETIGLSLTDINKQHTVYDLWDGYIDVILTKTVNPTTGELFEPKVGLTVQDATNLGTAEVVFYQRFSSADIRLYVKNISGNWALGSLWSQNREIRWLSDGSDDPVYDPAIGFRVFGQIKERAFPLPSQGIGKIVVLRTENIISVPAENTILDGEYWFYREEDVYGVPRPANTPSAINNDWVQVYNLPVAATGIESGLTNEGMYAVFERRGVGQFVKLGAFTVPERGNNVYLGDDLKFGKLENLYKLFVKMRGVEDSNNPGRIYIILNGTTEDYQFGWEFSRDKKYKGQFVSTRSYFEGDIVYYGSKLYSALTNIAPAPFLASDWNEISDPKDYVGYIPNLSGLVVGDDSSVIDAGGLSVFAKDFDVSKNGEVIVVSTEYTGDKPNALYIYRNINGSFYRAQTIESPNKTTSYGDNVSISNDGKVIAVSATFDDTVENDSGKVYIYVQANGEFALTQQLTSPTKERAELFGWTIDFDGDRLAIGSRNGDAFIETTFSDGTTFDSGFTQFKSFDKDTGIVRIYERRDNVMAYAQHIDYDDSDFYGNPVNLFGRNILLSNNHVYVGLPSLQRTATREGVVVDYRIADNTFVWNVLRAAKNTVDVNKIKRVMLYDVSKSEIVQYLDYIDVLQGKIAGPAEQELSFKTYYDPAVYTTGTVGNIDPTNSWNSQQVGKLWWDLTNAKFLNPYQSNVIFSANNWNLRASVINTIDVYEWVESTYLPSEWDDISGTDRGLVDGITGLSRNGDDAYVVKRKYDEASKTFTTYYYFWVRGKTTIPDVEGRILSANDVANLIENPAGEGYKFISLISPTEFALHNCESLIRGNDIALSVQYWTIDNQQINIHNQYQIITEGLDSSRPNRDVEKKWIDSLVGYDAFNREVPSSALSPKEKYGILNRPRQGWFVNRDEALKQVINRINSVLVDTLIIDDKDITSLTNIDEPPSAASNRYDRTVDTLLELQFVGVAKAEQASISPIIEDGKIVRLTINNGGRGYLVPPIVTILGNGKDAEIVTEIDTNGTVIAATILNQGEQYDSNTRLSVRRYTVLVKSDSTLNGKWALYERDTVNKEWILVESQAYDVVKYWNYIDWYSQGYNAFTEIDHIIEFAYDLSTLSDSIGDIVKIKNVGTGGWLLLEKIDNQSGVDYSVNYNTIGRESGTIQFKSTLYDVSSSLVGYDTTTYDVLSFDALPTAETRIILETIRDKIFIDDLAIEWNKLFFASLRYVFSEQKYVDWAFKTSFIKAKHNVGELDQPVNFKNDNLPNYEDYIKEVKPFKSKIREYLSSYEKIDNSQTITTDFDLPPRYVSASEGIKPQVVKIVDGTVIAQDADLTTYPNKNWLDNIGYKVIRIELADAGIGYTNAPEITIEGSGTGATAVASLGRNGRISAITVTNQGTGYLSAPTVTISGSVGINGREAKAVAIIGDTPVRAMQTVIKFDRVSGVYEFINLDTSETFVASGLRTTFELQWPMDLRTSRVTVYRNDAEVLGRRYTYTNVLDTSKGYDRYVGSVEFIDPPEAGSVIRIEYYKDIKLLKAQDRINLAYEPTAEQYGKTLGQLMDGVDYGGVEVRSFSFGGTTGWDSGNWFTQGWDVYDTTFEDEIFRLDGSTLSIDLSKPLENGVEYNVYRMSYDINGQLLRNDRIDDPDYDGTPMLDKPWVSANPIIGDGTTTTIFLDELGVVTVPEDSTEQTVVVVIRKSTSDGSFIADPESYDTAISGGDLAYSTATGLNSADINIDGDGFVTQTTSKGPEEVVPGQVLDTLDITVYEKPTGGASQITSRNYIGDGVTKVFNLGNEPGQFENLFVKVGYEIVTKDNFTVDFDSKQIIFDVAPAANSRVSLVDVGLSAASILDIDNFTGDGQSIDFLTNARWEEGANGFVTVDGITTNVTLIESDESYEYPHNFIVRFPTPPREGANIRVLLAVGGVEIFQQYSQVTIDTFVADGSTTQFDLTQAPFEQQPESSYILVKVGNRILNPGYSERFVINSNQREYQLDLTQIPVASVNAYDLAVYLNDIELEYVQTWTFEGAGNFDPTLPPQSQPGSTITLTAGIGETGDILKVYVLTDGEYRMGYYESDNNFVKTPGTINFNSAFNEDDLITVYQFSNHNSQGFERQVFDVEERTQLTIGTPEYYRYQLLRKGYITLRKPARAAQYVWVIKNGTLLSPNVDYSVTDNRLYVKLVEEPAIGDELQVLHFANDIVNDKFGFRMFKDMLNRTHYKRLDDVYQLAEPLNWYDKSIFVVDAEGLPSPEYNAKYPGVIFINGERIEFYGRNGNELLQLRRGTLGTGVKNLYPAGTFFMEQGIDATIPYKDETDVVTVIAGGYSKGSTLYANSVGMSVTSITYNFNNNTAFPVRVAGVYEQICTVKGAGFTDRVVVYAGEVECTTRYISDTQLEFDVPGLPVGAYDLIIVNPFTTIPIDTPLTSYVVPGAIKSVQILLPYAPVPNPASATNWYKKTAEISVADIVPGRFYIVNSIGTTNFTDIGSPNATIGTAFQATAVGTGTGTVLDFTSIPYEYWEPQDIEVFEAGRRLRKTPIAKYDYLTQDSPEGDITLEAEYAVNRSIGAYVRLTDPPPEGASINIIRKIGKTWNEPGVRLADSDSNVAKFLRAKTTDLPR